MASTIHIFTISLENENDHAKYNVEDEDDKYIKTKINDSIKTPSQKFISPHNIAEKYSKIHKEECFRKDSTTISALEKSSEDVTIPGNGQYITKSSCLPENNINLVIKNDQLSTNEYSSVVLSVSTYPVFSVGHNSKKNYEDQSSETIMQPQNSTESCASEFFSQAENTAKNSLRSMPYFTYDTSVPQSLTMCVGNNNTVLQEQCTRSLTTSVTQFQHSSLENLDQCFALPQNEYKSLEISSVSTIGPPPMYEPTLLYEPPDFYEAPPPYTIFPLESIYAEEITQYNITENRENGSISNFKKEVIRFLAIAFLVISAIYMVETLRRN